MEFMDIFNFMGIKSSHISAVGVIELENKILSQPRDPGPKDSRGEKKKKNRYIIE